ncbi:hypothetical protein A3I99_01615 [Candidatus Kaiserbacteria bacterium RIFCSPLOWO2_02_FULL_45_11b]|uniref:DUF1294 domain-containing protein n=1 Tax=Candidatus Kaiserbacteria bacterium RIFCSPLOWO2_12_FULL_45_26 TaxID=1798525 RepID=A0A1F6FFW9_9BACT|nr:MAG: hypothetical protein A2Z56_03955 [Candidatus Kaiserbacteria bacterium RIFCSPHIGHO2_12_45_16]OGG70528.1 MAG: hypothetical protein A2929_04860 [Candidatus Kaiserbacteria bacterium RIFCSPLOWO2_01_FULL_45_25]OGG81013.1 MAG: hypothetical protein A3I99_01615 [Candidatus Kaiserbacteria bacterium RIFCSPLOWO2_02_FULL_45_11b]OGG84756.1 MAG: hypothetical protein A3G90_01565 [Candidatus Kaiserbacteria bacterium RIFCSPLOWO2_12_FULL_45_26]
MTLDQLLIGSFAAINILAFGVMAYDKRISRRGSGNGTERDRIPEGLIFFMATALGSVGVYLGMLTLRHKTRKWYFQIGIPLLILQNLAAVYLVWEWVV